VFALSRATPAVMRSYISWYFFAVRSIMCGWDDGSLSDAMGSGPVVFIRLCEWVGGGYGDSLDLSFMYFSNLEITSLTRSFTIATFSSTLAIISASFNAFVV
jgi:hypothetical protein